jgi:L-ascorbate metabolism protein UlaG (beta-lactamase superfamily)
VSALSPDIVMLPVGDDLIIDVQKAIDAITKLSPDYVVPMCYEDAMSIDTSEFVNTIKSKFPSTEVLLF